MIYVDRAVHLTPEILDPNSSPRLQKELEEAKRFFSGAERNRDQRRFNFKVSLDRSVKLALREMFHAKCAYCEVKLDRVQAKQKYGVNGDLEHYRPKSSVLEVPDHPGYWWLASEWNNLLIACQHCNRGSSRSGGKANRFPLKREKSRAFKPTNDLTQESPLLLNPCIDRPEEHLVFSNDGQVFSDTERGKATILVLGLNRNSLVQERLKAIDRIKETAKILDDTLLLLRGNTTASSELNRLVEQLTTVLNNFTKPSQDLSDSLLGLP